MVSVLCSCVFVLIQVHYVLGGIRSKTYHRIVPRGPVQYDIPLRQAPASNVIGCAKLCLQEGLCLYLKFNVTSCALYSKPPTLSEDHTVRYYGQSDKLSSSPANIQTTEQPHADKCKEFKGFIFVANPRLCYKLLENYSKNYPSSENYCKSNGARLIILSKDEAFDYILRIMRKKFNVAQIWVGMYIDDWGRSMWSDGSTHVKQWAEGRPPNTQTDCVIMAIQPAIGSSGLHAAGCNEGKKFICEIPNP